MVTNLFAQEQKSPEVHLKKCPEKFHKILRKIIIMEYFFGQSCRVSLRKGSDGCFPENFLNISAIRSSRSQMFSKIGVLKIFANFTGNHLCWSLLLIKLQVFSLIKKRLHCICFPVKFAKLLRTHFFTEHILRLLLQSLYFWKTSASIYIWKNRIFWKGTVYWRASYSEKDFYIYNNSLQHQLFCFRAFITPYQISIFWKGGL